MTEASDLEDKLAAFLADLDAKAQGAIPGRRIWRWKSGSLHVAGDGEPYTYGQTILHPTCEYDSGVDLDIAQPDADFIEALSPEVVRALVSVAQTANRGTAMELDVALDELRRVAEAQHG